MGFRIERGEAVQDAVRRIAREQIEKAHGEIEDEALAPHEVVHRLRKRCKKLRGLLRLVRPALGDAYSRENRAVRDAARRLSDARDGWVLQQTWQGLLQAYEALDEDGLAPVTKGIEEACERLLGRCEPLPDRIAQLAEALDGVRRRSEDWQLDDDAFEAVAGGLRKTYERGRKAMARAAEEPSVEGFHEWRKRAKYHRYHVRLLEPLWRDGLGTHRAAAHVLTDRLGDDHDLAVLRATLDEDPDRFGGRRGVQAASGVIDRRRRELEAEAFALGRRLFAEKPRALADRLHGYWQAWREDGDAPEAGRGA